MGGELHRGESGGVFGQRRPAQELVESVSHGLRCRRSVELSFQIRREWVGGRVELGGECGEVLEVVGFEEGLTGPSVFFNGGSETLDHAIKRREERGHRVGLTPSLRLGVVEHAQEKRLVVLVLIGAVVVGADVVEVGIIGQGILRDDVHVTAVESGIQAVLSRGE